MQPQAHVPVAVGTPQPAAQPAPAYGTRPSPPAYQPHETPPVVHLSSGTRIQQYELIRELGRGGMGQVWAARDTKLGRRVAIKFLITQDRGVAERFLIEARATAQCSHDNIVIIHEADEVGGLPYMVLEFLEGQTLRGAMGNFQSGARLPASRAVELMLPVARALERAHKLGIVHRDLKPENVFVTSGGQVKVLDFGIAKALGGINDGRTIMPNAATLNIDVATKDGALVGTLPYMSPEQMGTDTVDHRSDLWAFGIMMFEMLAGRHPIEPLTAPALISNAVQPGQMPSVAAYAQGVPPELTQVVDLCLRKNKQERVGTATDIVTRLEMLMPHRRGRQLVEGESPYPGLSAFQETDADRFFGRERDVARMVARVRELPLTGIVGPSGVGKSSFVRAGVGPALKTSGESWDVVTLRPGRQPMAALATIVLKLTTQSGMSLTGELANHQTLTYRLWNEPGYLGSLLRERAQRMGRRVLLFIDQFEELYTLVPEPNERRAFTAALSGVADDAATPLRVVVSMRSDFLDRVAEDPRFMEDLSKGLVFLAPPDRDGLRDALVQPVEMVGHRFESQAMVDDMLNALQNTPGALPLLQFAAAKLWDARDRERRLLTEASYRAIGGISGALATHADDVVASMSAPAQKLTQKVFRRLVTPERTRAIVETADLEQLAPDRAELARIIDQLVAARLLVVQTRGDGGGGTVEIVHESLIDRWPTLRRWLDEEQEDAAFVAQLAQAAKQWEAKGHPAGLLWRGDAMEEARRWFNARPRELPPRERAYLDAVFALDRRGKRMRRAASIIAFVVLGTVAAGASVAVVLVNSAKDEANANETKAEKALADFQKADAERAAADKRKAEAEAASQQAELAKADAVKKQVAEQQKNVALQQENENVKHMSEEELRKKNAELSASLAQVTDAKKRAEEQTAKAEAANAQLKKQRDEAIEDAKKIHADKLSHDLK
jgi:serine/threonine protein kinase